MIIKLGAYDGENRPPFIDLVSERINGIIEQLDRQDLYINELASMIESGKTRESPWKEIRESD